MRTDGYLIFRIENGRLENYGVHESYEAAEKRMAYARLSADWNIAKICCYFRAQPPRSATRGANK
jgi:hypothetical protein